MKKTLVGMACLLCLLGGVIAIDSVLGLGLVAAKKEPITREQVSEQLKKANYCNVASDCTQVSGGCPFGNSLVNVKEARRIYGIYDQYFERGDRCVFEYSGNPGDKNPLCEQNKCIPGPWPSSLH
jgi:hypothetical protein